MDRGLRQRIQEDQDNHCQICGNWCGDSGSPHHIVKRSEEPILTNCKKNILWTCVKCHRDTENVPGFNKKLQRRLQERYFKIFLINKHYSVKEIAQIVQMPIKDVEKAMQKGVLKWEFVDGAPKAKGIETIRFLLGGKLK